MIIVDSCGTERRILTFKGGLIDVKARRVVLTLDPAEYAALEQLGAAQERDAWQQARWLLRRAIAEQQAGERAEADDARPA